MIIQFLYENLQSMSIRAMRRSYLLLIVVCGFDILQHRKFVSSNNSQTKNRVNKNKLTIYLIVFFSNQSSEWDK